MIVDLDAKQIHQINGGRKTQMRVRVHESRTITRKNGTTYESRPFDPQEGQTIGVKPARKHGNTEEREERPTTWITITETRDEILGQINLPDALAEGHRTTSEFKAWWVHRHDTDWIKRIEKVFCPTCTDPEWPGDELPACPMCAGEEIVPILPKRTPDELEARFDDRHSFTLVRVVRFEIDRATRPRRLAPVGRGDEHGYFNGAPTTERRPRANQHEPFSPTRLADEPEGIDSTIVRYFTADAHERRLGQPGRRQEAFEREAQNLSRRLRQGVRVIDPNDQAVAAHLQRIRDEIAALERLRKNTPKAA